MAAATERPPGTKAFAVEKCLVCATILTKDKRFTRGLQLSLLRAAFLHQVCKCLNFHQASPPDLFVCVHPCLPTSALVPRRCLSRWPDFALLEPVLAVVVCCMFCVEWLGLKSGLKSSCPDHACTGICECALKERTSCSESASAVSSEACRRRIQSLRDCCVGSLSLPPGMSARSPARPRANLRVRSEWRWKAVATAVQCSNW
eukprot:535596-Pleurochrysis_carterae.AAC.1